MFATQALPSAPSDERTCTHQRALCTALRRYGMDMYMMSVKTGLFCRELNATVLCDVVNVANATAINYLGNALSYNNMSLVSNDTLFISPSV
jgi:hypothetical protein